MPEKILIVEDDKKTASLIKLYLEREGFQAVIAYDGRQALELAELMDVLEPRFLKTKPGSGFPSLFNPPTLRSLHIIFTHSLHLLH